MSTATSGNTEERDEGLMKVGPVGYCPSIIDERESYDHVTWDVKGVTKIARIYISHAVDRSYGRITSLQFQYVHNGNMCLSPVYGHHLGTQFEMVDLNVTNEYIIGLSGTLTHSGSLNSRSITSLSFETNVKNYGPFGSGPRGAEPFSFRFGPGNNFGGFYGRFCTRSTTTTTTNLSGIGVYVKTDLPLPVG